MGETNSYDYCDQCKPIRERFPSFYDGSDEVEFLHECVAYYRALWEKERDA